MPAVVMAARETGGQECAQPQEGAPSALVVRAAEKSFGTTRAVQGVDFEVRAGEIVGLMGGNGAGKSTLVKMIGGLVVPDAGDIDLLGRRVSADYSPRAAMAAGLRFVHQELSLCPNLRVFENFAVELPDIIKGLRWKARAIDFARAALAEVFPGSGIDPRVKVSALSIGQRQMVEIARAVSHPATRLVILDEPTSSLGAREGEQLRACMRRLRQRGVSFVFISHRLRETLDLADRVTVMRNGRVAWTGPTASISPAGLVELLGGAHAAAPKEEKVGGKASTGDVAVRVEGLSEGPLRGVGFEARRGEIVGLAGLEGSGQREVLHALFAGNGEAVSIHGRVAFVSGDRAGEGVFPLWSIDENITVSSLSRLTRWGLLSMARLRELAGAWFRNLDIRAASGEEKILSLSGGNQQKAMIARALAAEPDIILLDDPTRGVDLGTKAQLYALFRTLAEQGRTIIWHSSDEAEFAECDRTLVMGDGTVVSTFSRANLTEERIVEASFQQADGPQDRPHGQIVAERARRREQIVSALIPVVTFAIIFAVCVALNPRIATPFGLTLVFSAAFVLAFATASQLFTIAAGDIDLGVGTFIGLVNAVAATWLVSDPWLAALCFLAMLCAYPLMGLFIEARRVPAIIVTLGLSFVWLGLASLRLPRAGGSAPDWLVELLRLKIPLLPMPMLLCIVPAAVAYLVLMVWRYGAVLRGYGASPAAIEAAGWSPRLAKASLYFFAGAFAFLAGVLVTASTRGGDPTGSVSMTLLSVAAVILGGAAFSGGVVAPVGALFGTLTLVLVGTLLSLLGVNAIYLPMVQGLLLLGAVGVRTLFVGRSPQ